jgi:hypothetical protein
LGRPSTGKGLAAAIASVRERLEALRRLADPR